MPSQGRRRRSSSSSGDSRSRSQSGSRSKRRDRHSRGDKSDVVEHPITSEKPEYLNARVFVGHLPSDKITKEELQAHFARYGQILDCTVHPKGYGFVQFVKESDARNSVKLEARALLKGTVIDVKMAAEGRHDRLMVRERRRSPPPYAERAAGYPARAPPGRERSPLRDPYDDRYRDPYRDAREPLPPPRDDPYYVDPYRRAAPADPYYDRYRDDPYRRLTPPLADPLTDDIRKELDRRDPYADPYRERAEYRDPYREPYDAQPRKPPTECIIIMMNNQLRGYAEALDRRLKSTGLITEIATIPEDRTIQKQIEAVSRRGILFAIVINSQNEVHLSLTLNILHGTPQEHRNMPIDDAMSLVARSFERYMQALREKAPTAAAKAPTSASAAPAPAAASPAANSRLPTIPFLPASSDVAYLLNLLADNRQLTIEELDKVIVYLRERRDKLYEGERGRQPSSSAVDAVQANSAALYGGGDQIQDETVLQQQQQQELQSKILSILNGSGAPSQGTNGGSLGVSRGQVNSQPMMGLASPRNAPVASRQSAGNSSNMNALINFDNPSVQKALDNLIQSGPNLLRNISAASQGPQTMATTSGPMVGRDSGRMGVAMTHGSQPGLLGNAPNRFSGLGAQTQRLGGQQSALRPRY